MVFANFDHRGSLCGLKPTPTCPGQLWYMLKLKPKVTSTLSNTSILAYFHSIKHVVLRGAAENHHHIQRTPPCCSDETDCNISNFFFEKSGYNNISLHALFLIDDLEYQLV